MLDILHRDGRGRIAQWKPGQDGPTARTPALVWPDTTHAAAPPWVQVEVTARPVPASPAAASPRIQLASGGTWFHPTPHLPGHPLEVPPVVTAPSTTVQVLPVGDELAVFHDAAGWAHNPRNLVPAFAKARTEATPGRLLWAPGVGTPADYAVWCHLGVDLFDASPLLLAAARGQGLTPDGPVDAAQAGRLAGAPGPLGFEALAAFNAEQARQELERVAQAVRAGALRALAERRCYAGAAMVETLRRFDREHAFLEAAAPRHRATPLPAMTAESLWMPEVEAFRRALRDAYEPPRTAKVLVLLPCSQGKPYKMSRSHRIFARALDDSGIRHLLHEVMVTSPLGLVPRELEEVYPANQYDIPVTGHWMRDEEAIVKEQLAALLDKHEYAHVVVHTGQATFDVFRHLLPDARHTCLHHPTSPEDLQRLRDELARLRAVLGNGAAGGAAGGTAGGAADARGGGRDRKLEDLRSLLAFQHGAAVADAMTEGAQAHGRMPFVKLSRGGAQLGQTTPDRGVLSLTLEGAAVLARHGRKRVQIGDFRPKGTSSLFAVGVESADPDVRAGDEVVVMHGDEVRGCGVAEMSAEEMAHLQRGIAVTLRHTAAPPAKAVAPTAQAVAP